MNALMLMPRAAASRRTCLASWSSSEIVVLMMHHHNVPSSGASLPSNWSWLPWPKHPLRAEVSSPRRPLLHRYDRQDHVRGAVAVHVHGVPGLYCPGVPTHGLPCVRVYVELGEVAAGDVQPDPVAGPEQIADRRQGNPAPVLPRRASISSARSKPLRYRARMNRVGRGSGDSRPGSPRWAGRRPAAWP